MKKLLLYLVLLFSSALALNAQTGTGTVNFTWQATGLNVQFTNTSDPLTGFNYLWTFGDGAVSDAVSPSHTYQQTGAYTVCLRKRTPNNVTVDSICKTVALTSTGTCTADFRDSTVGPRTKKFTPILNPVSTANLQVSWTFGDGSSSTDFSPTHQYAQPGTYNVCIRIVYGNGCVAEHCRNIVVEPTITCSANYHDSITGPLTVHFWAQPNDTPAVASYNWFFGDNTTATTADPTHQYAQPGSYYACLRIQYVNGCVAYKCDSIHLIPVTTCTANYHDSIVGPLTIHFWALPNSTPAVSSYNWFFGDGTSATTADPTHQFAQPGTYYVCLRIQYINGCYAYKCDSITIQGNTTCVTDFHDSLIGPLTVQFFPTLPVVTIPVQVTWNFGDGTTSSDLTPVHHYTQPGTYNVCLRMQWGNCVAEKCHLVVIPPVTTCEVNYTDSIIGPLTVHFWSIVTSSAVTSYQWNFGDGTSSNDPNPVHHYTQPGTYHVCLIVTYANGCITYKCKDIVIPPSTTCEVNYIDSIVDPLTVHFWSVVTSNAVTSYLWVFGDNTTSTEPNPIHHFTEPGTYHVCLRVEYANGCVAYKCKDIIVQGSTTQCQAYFTDSSTGPYSVHFIPHTMPQYIVVSYLWTFGDGTASTASSPNHTYNTSGSYYVCLTVKYGLPGSTMILCETHYCHIVIIAGNGCGAIIRDSIAGPLNVQFWSTLTSNNVTSLAWNFGDGTSSNVRNPLHHYQHGGHYRVCLHVTYAPDNCEANICEDIMLADEPCKDSIRVEPYFGPNNTGLTYQFFAVINRNDPVLFEWNFGDGTFSLQRDPIKNYLQPGTYNVCLRVTFANGCIANYCRPVNITRTCRVEIEDSLISTRVYKFSVRSSRSGIASYQWNFGDGGSSTEASPTHTFAQNGNYHICVRVEFTDGCVAYDCDDLNVFRLAASNVTVSSYPSPAVDQVTFTIENAATVRTIATISIFNTTGVMLKKQIVSGNNSFTVNVSDMRAGSYIAEIKSDGVVARKKFVKL